MANESACRTLQLYVPTVNPPSAPQQQPIIALRDADVIISLHFDGSHDLHLRSDMLMKTSHFFNGALREQFVETKTTGSIDPGNGTLRAMKRFELEFLEDGEHLLIGKNTVTDPDTRADAYDDDLESKAYRSLWMKRREEMEYWRVVTEEMDNVPERKIIEIVNELGFTMLCGFPTKGLVEIKWPLPRMYRGIIFMDGRRRPMDMRRRYKEYFIQRLVQWIDFYGVLESVRWQLIDWIMNIASSGSFRDTDFDSTPTYLRIATVFRDQEFFEWVLNKTPFFNWEANYHLSGLDRTLGLGAWAPVFDKRIIDDTELQLNLQYVDREEWIEPYDRELMASARCYWQLMVARSYFTYSASMKGLWPVLGVLDTFFNDIPDDPAASGGMREDETDGYRDIFLDVEHSAAYPLLDLSVKDRALVVQQIDIWVDLAQEMILKFLTPAPEEPYRVRLQLGNFWKRYGFPWDYRDKDKSEGVLFSLIANQDLTVLKKDLCHFQAFADA